MRITRLVKYLGYLLLCTYFVVIHSCETLKVRVSKTALQQQVKQATITDTTIAVENTNIRYVTIGNPKNQPLLLLHGSPSSLNGWKALYTDTAFTNNFYIIAIDRPGYGFSNFGKVETNIQQQAAIVEAVLTSIGIRDNISIVGSSYGGPVAVQTVINNPNRFKQLTLLSASVKPGAEKVYWISYLMTFPIIKYMFPAIFRMSSEEKLSHAKQLATITNWQNIVCKTVIIHGNADNLIYYENAVYAQKKLTNAASALLVTLEGKGHALIFTEPAFLKKVLQQYL